MRKPIRKLLLALAALLAIGVTAGMLTVDRWLFVAMDPGPFDPQKTPTAPDYQKPKAWAALPTTKDGADVALPSHPATDQRKAKVDAFYIHPTTIMGPNWNMPTHDPAARKATRRGGTLIQASAFNACCAVYGPRYRQAHGKAFVRPNKHGNRAVSIAYNDVRRAFHSFLRQHNKDRPFILAGHSQGAFHATRLLKEEIWGKPPAKRLVAAYLLAAPITKDSIPGIPLCSSPTQTGCLIAWNSRGPRYTPNHLEFPHPNPTLRKTPLAGLLCVNPLTWKHDQNPAPASKHQGAIFFDAPQPRVIPAFASAQCKEGRLLISHMKPPYRDTMSRILDWIMGPQNYHPIEFQLFYLNIRNNAQMRAQAFLQQRTVLPSLQPTPRADNAP